MEISENQLNGFENGRTQLFNSGGVVKCLFAKKWSIPLTISSIFLQHLINVLLVNKNTVVQ